MLLPFNVHALGDVAGDKDEHIGIRSCLSSLDNIKNCSQLLKKSCKPGFWMFLVPFNCHFTKRAYIDLADNGKIKHKDCKSYTRNLPSFFRHMSLLCPPESSEGFLTLTLQGF